MRQTRTLGWASALLLFVMVAGACNASYNWKWQFGADAQSRPAPRPTIVSGDSGLPGPASMPIPAKLATEELIKLSTEEQMEVVVAPERDLRDLAMRLIPDVGEIPIVVNTTVPEYEVGDRLEFWAHDM